VTSGIALAGDFAYVVETRRDRSTGQQTDYFTVLDVRTPAAPQRRGTVQLRVATFDPSSGLASRGAGLNKPRHDLLYASASFRRLDFRRSKPALSPGHP
jgi:hypothetical protein